MDENVAGHRHRYYTYGGLSPAERSEMRESFTMDEIRENLANEFLWWEEFYKNA